MSKFPVAVEIEINSDCNQACAYCPNSKHERVEKGRMKPELFREILRQLRELDFEGRVSYHFYNEPLLSPDLDEFVVLTKGYLPRCEIHIYTNGDFLDKKRILGLFDRGVDRFTVTKHVKNEIREFEEAFAALSPDERARIRFFSYRDIPLTNRGGTVAIRREGAEPPLALACMIPSSALVITLNGNVIPCYEDFFQKHVMGNVLESSLGEIWNSPRYREFRKTLQLGKRAELEVCKACNNNLIMIWSQ